MLFRSITVNGSKIDRHFTYRRLDSLFELNRKQSQGTSPVAKPKVVYRQQEPPKQQNVVEAVDEAVVGNGLDLFKVGPGYDPQEEAFAREMNRRKKKKKGIRF